MSTTGTAAKPAYASKKPIVSKRFGKISVAVFERDVSTPAGKSFMAKDFVLQRSWKDKQGNWQDQSISLGTADILAAQHALTAAYIESFEKGTDDEE
jgi:hypothetical protein